MKILNFGSLNIDYVYQIQEFVKPGETISALGYAKHSGGKGLNQSIALANADMEVYHAGKIGRDGIFLLEQLKNANINCDFVDIDENVSSGHAIIQVSAKGENSIVLFGGSNQTIDNEHVSRAINFMNAGDFLLLQNEISNMTEIINQAAKKQLRIFFNPAPMNEKVLSYPLDKIETFIVNETEGATLANVESAEDYLFILEQLNKKYPKQNILMTLGARGAIYYDVKRQKSEFVEAEKVAKVVDTTAAGDTFIGFFLYGIANNKTSLEAMKLASKASAYCIARSGAAQSIPKLSDLSL